MTDMVLRRIVFNTSALGNSSAKSLWCVRLDFQRCVGFAYIAHIPVPVPKSRTRCRLLARCNEAIRIESWIPEGLLLVQDTASHPTLMKTYDGRYRGDHFAFRRLAPYLPDQKSSGVFFWLFSKLTSILHPYTHDIVCRFQCDNRLSTRTARWFCLSCKSIRITKLGDNSLRYACTTH